MSRLIKSRKKVDHAKAQELYLAHYQNIVNRREQSLMNVEAKLGGRYFQKDFFSSTEFFCLNPTTWVLHEVNIDQKTGKKINNNIIYEIHVDKILKFKNTQEPEVLSKEEELELMKAIQFYQTEIELNLYQTNH